MITSVTGFLGIIQKINNGTGELFYKGHSDKSYEIEPAFSLLLTLMI